MNLLHLPSITFETPALALAGLCIALIAIAGYLVRRTGTRSQLVGMTILRALAVAAVTLGLAGPMFVKTDDRTAVIFMVDKSRSISSQALQTAAEAVKSMAAGLKPKDMAGVVYFGSDARVACQPVPPEKLQFVSPEVSGDSTDISKALRTARLSFPEGYAKKIVLLSDGNETVGNAMMEANYLASDGIVLDAVPSGGSTGPDVSVKSVSAPDRVRTGDPYEVKVIVQSTGDIGATLSILKDGITVSSKEITARKGTSSYYIEQESDKDRPILYEARLKAADDETPGNNRAQTVVDVRNKPKVLILGETEGESRLLLNTLGKQGINAQFASPASAPQELESINAYDGIILNNLSALHFSDSYLALLKSYVSDLGGGLLAIGGPQSFGLGGYRDTPLEDVLPVSMDIRQKIKFPSMAMVVILDRSGSMEGEGLGATKLDLAKEATMSVVDLLPDDAQVGVLAFDSEYKWVVPLMSARNKDAIADYLSAIQTGGGTTMYPPMVEAYRKLKDAKAVIKHIITITDGQSEKGPFEDIVRQMAGADITVSTVAIGSDSERSLLSKIAEIGRGRAYYTNDIYSIPRIFVTEAFMASRSMIIEKKFVPALKNREPVLKGIDPGSIPPLSGIVASAPKPMATLNLATPDGDPVLASWRIGLGKSVAFLSDASGNWSRQWVQWTGSPRFWAQLTRWIMRSWQNSPLQVTGKLESGKAVISVDAIDQSGNYIDFLNLSALMTRAGGETVRIPLAQKGPGRYVGEAPVTETGSYMVAVSDGDGAVEPQTLPLSLPYPEELKVRTVNRTFLTALADSTGGSVISPTEFSKQSGLSPAKTYKELWPACLLMALIFLLLDLAIRSIPEDQWMALLAVGFSVRRIRSAMAESLARQSQAPQRYEDMIWKAKQGETKRAADRQYISEISPSKAAGLYIARLKRERGETPDNAKDDNTGSGE